MCVCVGGESGSFCYSPGWEREYVLNLFVLLNHSEEKRYLREPHTDAPLSVLCMDLVCALTGVFFGSKRETGSIYLDIEKREVWDILMEE